VPVVVGADEGRYYPRVHPAPYDSTRLHAPRESGRRDKVNEPCEDGGAPGRGTDPS
jgi:hypothetical protein